MPDISPSNMPNNAVKWDDVLNTLPMTYDSTKIPTENQVASADDYIIGLVGGKTAVRFWDGGTWKNGTPNTGDIVVFTDTTTTNSGDAVFHLTSNRTSGGTALASSIVVNSINGTFVDASSNYNKGAGVVSNAGKTITISTTKQTPTGIIVLSLNVVGSITFPASPNGTVVNLFCIGVSV